MHLFKPERYHPSARATGSAPSPTYPSLTKQFLLILGAHHVPLSSPLPSTVIAWACLFRPLIFPKYHKPTRVCFHFPGIIPSPSIPHNPPPPKNKAKQSLLIPTEKHPLTQGPSSLEWRFFFFLMPQYIVTFPN